jgi:uncharacterized protein YndB with AHSA1/START domain
MIEFTIETEIERAASEVFAYVTDPDKLHTWQTNTVSAVQEGDGPFGLGTRIREVHRAPGGKQLASLVEVSEYEPDRVFGLRMVEGSLPIHARISLEPTTDGGTEMSFTAHGRLEGPIRLLQPVLARTLRKQFAADTATLKRMMESEGVA